MWQVPVFLLGVAALVGMWVFQPFNRLPDDGRRFAEELAAVRKALDGSFPDTARALAVGEELLEQVERFPDRAGEVHFLLGSAYARRAGEVSREQAPYAWRKAREHLERAEALGVADADHPRLLHRLARSWYHTGVEARRVLDLLGRTSEAADADPADYLAMLAQLYLRLPTPDVEAALEANARQLALPADHEDLLAPARLLRGQLLLRQHKADEARKVLARIRPGDRPGVYAEARRLRAESLQQDQLWKEAAPLWEEIARDARTPAPAAARARFRLGVCYRRLDQADAAARAWEEALQADPETAQAAALCLAELRLKQPDVAVGLFERALCDVAAPGDYHNTLLDAAEARRLAEQGCREILRTGDFARAQRVVALLQRLAPDAGGPLAGEIADAWGQDCLRRAAGAVGAEAAPRREEAAAHFRSAGAAYEAAAGSSPGAADQARLLWLSAGCYRQGGQPDRAADVLQRFLKRETDPRRLAEGWYTLAEVRRGRKESAAARDAYHQCIELNVAPYSFRARYLLAWYDIEDARRRNDPARLDDAEAALQQNLELMRVNPDPEAHEKTLRALAALLIQRGNYRMAAIRLQEVLDRYPRHPDHLDTRRQLADCYGHLAAQEDRNLRAGLVKTPEAQLHYREQRRLWLQKAQAHYQKLVDDLSAESPRRALTEAEDAVLRHAGFALAECYFEQGMYADAVRYYEKMAGWYERQADGLKALQQITRCYWVMSEKDKARATIARLRIALKQLPDAVFTGRPGVLSRPKWEEWADWAEKQ